MGGSNKRRGLHLYVCKTNLLDEGSITELLIKMIDITSSNSTNPSLSYELVTFYREKNGGSLRGVMLVSACGEEGTQWH